MNFLTSLVLHKARSFLSVVRQNLNDLVNLAREETEDILTLSMVELEKERDALRELNHN